MQSKRISVTICMIVLAAVVALTWFNSCRSSDNEAKLHTNESEEDQKSLAQLGSGGGGIPHGDNVSRESYLAALDLFEQYCSIPSDDPLVWEVRLGLRLVDRCASDHRAYLGFWPPSVEYLFDEGFMPVIPSEEGLSRIKQIVELRGWQEKALDPNTGELIDLGEPYPSEKSRILAARMSTLKWQLSFRFPHSIATELYDNSQRMIGNRNPAFWTNVYTGEPAREVPQDTEDYDTPEWRIRERGNYVVSRNDEGRIMYVGFIFPDNPEDE